MSFDLYDFINTDPGAAGSPDTINLWITQSIIDGKTESFVQGITVPKITSTDNLEIQLSQGTELIFQFPSGSRSVFKRSKVQTRKEFRNYFYIKLASNIQIPSGSLTFGISSPLFDFGILPDVDEKFRFQDYDSYGFNVSLNKKSTKHLIVDRSKSSPGAGLFTGKIVPGNFEALSASFFDNLLDTVPSRLVTETQECNYSKKSWNNLRYNGVSVDNRGVTGSEPALFFQSFDGVFFPSSSNNQTIKNLITGSLNDLDSDTTYFAVLGKISESITGYSTNYFTENTASALQYPYINSLSNFDKYSIFLYREREDNENIFIKVVNSKVLEKDSSKILKTDNLGRVIEITT